MKRLIIPAIALFLILGCNPEKPTTSTGTGTTAPKPGVAPPGNQKAAFHAPLRDLQRTPLSSIPTGRRDFRRDPPRVAEVIMEPAGGAAGNVRLLVRFAERGLPAVIHLESETAPVALRDDGRNGDERAGDGQFTAITQLPQDFVRERGEVARRLTSPQVAGGGEPLFRGRQLIPVKLPPPAPRGTRVLSPFDFPGPLPGLVTNSERSLLVRDVKVVGDKTRTGNPCVAGSTPTGPWSFASLMTEIANQSATGMTPSQFVRTAARSISCAPTRSSSPHRGRCASS